jgi:hypothetical protein
MRENAMKIDSKFLLLPVAALAAVAVGSLWQSGVYAQAPAAMPDFSGVYYPIMRPPPGVGLPKQGAPPPGTPRPKPTASAPLADGSQGRGPTSAALTPEYLAKWEVIRKSRMAGSSEYDPSAKCLPPGMPAMMVMFYGMEVMQTKDKITMFSELNDSLRRIFLDGRKPSAKVLADPTYAGYSMGHWEGTTLVVDTVGIRDDSYFDGFSPHSDQMTVRERIRMEDADLLVDQITVTDPKALTKPWEVTYRYRKAKPPQDELREFACAEGLAEAK